MLGPFHSFMTFDVITWFAERGVELKTEDDGRMFPSTDNSQTIIDCLMHQTKKNGIEIELNADLVHFNKEDDFFILHFANGKKIRTRFLILSSGSHERTWELLSTKGLSISKPVPSLFTFNFKNKKFNDLMGLSIAHAVLKIEATSFESSGPLLFTHWGFSGPAILRLSAWAARHLHARQYQFTLSIDFTGLDNEEKIETMLLQCKEKNAAKMCKNTVLFELPKRLWELLLDICNIQEKNWGDLSKVEFHKLHQHLCAFKAEINGKSTFKDEFVTCGGVDLKEVHMKTMECKKIPGLFFTGECLDIDAITGGFNFQAAWTTAYLVAKEVSSKQ